MAAAMLDRRQHPSASTFSKLDPSEMIERAGAGAGAGEVLGPSPDVHRPGRPRSREHSKVPARYSESQA
jgi:hypothetical protein